MDRLNTICSARLGYYFVKTQGSTAFSRALRGVLDLYIKMTDDRRALGYTLPFGTAVFV